MTQYLLLVPGTAVAAVLAVWICRRISAWRLKSFRVISLSGDAARYRASHQRGYIGKRRQEGTGARNEGFKPARRSKPPTGTLKKSRQRSAADKQLRKPWGW